MCKYLIYLKPFSKIFKMVIFLLTFFCREIVGIIETNEVKKSFGEGKNKKILKRFILMNNQTKRLRCIIWGEARVDLLEPILQTGHV